jgi:uncharacterized protein YggE
LTSALEPVYHTPMSYYSNEIVSVTSKGSAEADFVSASFKASVTTQGKTGLEAKEKAIPTIEALLKTIRAHAVEAGIDTNRLKTTFAVDVDTNQSTGRFIGYKAMYTISFTGTIVAAAPILHDALTSIEYVEAHTPIYNLDDSSDIHARAFADAVRKNTVKFGDQCKALGLDAKSFYPISWTVTADEHHGKTLSFTDATAKPIGLETGKGSIDIRVTIAYSRKS